MPTNNTRGLWRGKCVDNGEWFVGYLYGERDGVWYLCDRFCERYGVDPSTLGKCTGLHDKNGTLIFEGDIVEINHPYNGMSIHKVVLDDFCWNLEGFYASCFDYPSLAFSEGTEYMTVIGNVHDNPELLKGAENNGSRS